MESTLFVTITVAAILLAVLVVPAVVLARCYRLVPASAALIVTSSRGVRVLRRGGLVLPVIQRAELLDLGIRTIEIQRKGAQGLVCRDNIRADVTATFTLAVRDTEEDILKVAESIGVARANDPAALREMFAVRLEDTLRQAFREQNYESAISLRPLIHDQVLETLGDAIEGFEVRDVALGALEVTPLEHLDPGNILDAQGIRKITEIACAAKVLTSQLQQELAVMVIKSRMEAEVRAQAERQTATPP